MSDSFADLWTSSAPQKKQQSLGSLAQNSHKTGNQRKPQPDLFALLSSPSTTSARSSPSLRSLTPSNNPTPPPRQKQPADAFSDILSTSSFASSSSTQNLTIAERAALADKQRQQVLHTQKQQREADNAAWAGLDSLGGSLVPTAAPAIKANDSRPSGVLVDDDDWGLGDFGSVAAGRKVQPPATTKDVNSDWDFVNLESAFSEPAKPPAATSNTTKSNKTLWDLNEFISPPINSAKGPLSRTDSPSHDFDFGNREDGDGLLNTNEDDNDFMKVFGKSKYTSSPQPPRPQSSTPSPPVVSTSNTRAASPPPHILGQIVEMGFPVPQAKAALLASNNDVQAALDQLLSSTRGGNGGNGQATPSPTAASPAPPHLNNSGIPRRRDREIQRERERERDQRRVDSDPSPAGSGAGSSDIQVQAEQLFAQASEIGRGMFTKASLFWKEKKVQVQKAVEEQVASVKGSGSGAAGPTRGGRPKWMQESAEVEDRTQPRGGGFRDDDGDDSDDGEPQVRIPRRLDRQRDRERQFAQKQEAATASHPIEPEVDLFSTSEFVQQTNVHGNHYRQTKPSPGPMTNIAPTPPSRPKISRELKPIPSTIATLKAEANTAFKLGQFGNAEALYTRAIDTMGKSHHVYFVPLLNNRANARMKIGDMSGAVKDCESVVNIVCKNELGLSDDLGSLGGVKEDVAEVKQVDWEPSLDGEGGDGKLCVPMEGGVSEVVDMGEGLMKAIKRRAEAYEGMEKWVKARRDWDLLRSLGWARDNMRSEAGRGVGRCARMLGGESSSSSGLNNPVSLAQKPPVAKPKPRPSQPTSSGAKPSEAVRVLRDTNAQVEAEDLAKHALKDRVDGKLANWKNGKETNVRALLASLDLVLWEEVSSAKVGMHELVTPAQVKVKYMKAVAKVHPDKLNASNSTLEQRMIAQGVFGALNEAWNAFKQ